MTHRKSLKQPLQTSALKNRLIAALMCSVALLGTVIAPGIGQVRERLRPEPEKVPTLARTVIIGKLEGRDDFRKVRIRLQNQEYVIQETDDRQPFEVVRFSPRLIEIALGNEVSATQDPFSIRRVIYKFYSSERRLSTRLMLQQVDHAVFRLGAQAQEIGTANANYIFFPLRLPPNTLELIAYNLQHPILKNAAVRKAISFAIRRKEILENLLESQGEIARGSPFEPDRAYHPRGVEDYDYAPRKALSILNAAGWYDRDGDGVLERGGRKLSFTLGFESGIFLEQAIARRIQLDLFEIGIEILPIPYTKIQMDKKLASGEFEAVLLEHRFEESIDHLFNFFADVDRSFLKFRNNSFRRTYDNSKKSRNPEQILTLAKRMQVILNKQCVVTYLHFRWWDWHVFNIAKLDNFYDDNTARIKPLDEWIIRPVK